MYIILVYMSPLSTYTFISCLGRQIVSWLRQGSQNSLGKSKLMVLQHEFQEEFLDIHGIGVVHAKGSLEVSPCPPPNLFIVVDTWIEIQVWTSCSCCIAVSWG